MNTPTEEQIAKLPAWAREHIKSLKRERDVSVRALNEFQDDQTPSPFYFEESVCTGESIGPTSKRKYIQAHTINVEWNGVWFSVSAHDYGNSGEGIKLQWGSPDRTEDMAFIPDSYQSARIVPRNLMYPKQRP